MTPHVHLKNWQALEIEPTGEKKGLCDCCGTTTQKTWGFAHSGDSTIAAYFIKWTKGSPDHGAWFDLIIGTWGDGSNASHRTHASVEFRLNEGKPSFMVRNSNEANQDFHALADNGSFRDDIIGSELASHIFAITDAVYMLESVGEIRSWKH